MSKKGFSFRFCSFAGGFSLLLFSGISMAAGVDTGKIQPKVANVPVPAPAPPVKAAPPANISTETVVTMTLTVSPPPQAPKAVVNTPTYNVRPKTQVKLPTRTVTPKVNIKTPVRTRPIPGSAVKVLPPPNPPTRPQMQPGINLKRPLGQVPPMSAGNYPPPWPPLNKPAQQPRFSVKYPENLAPRNLPPSQKGQILDRRYAPPLPGPSGRGSGRGNGYGDDGYGRHYYGRTAYNPATPRLPANTAIPLPKTAPAQISIQPRAQSKLNVITPGTANGIGGSRVDRETLDRIQGIQEAATAAQVFKQLEELKNAKDLQNIGAAKSGLPGEGALAGDHLGIGAVGGEGDSSRSASRIQPGMGAIDRSGSADPAEGSGSAAPTGDLDTSRTGWVSDKGTSSSSGTFDIGRTHNDPSVSQEVNEEGEGTVGSSTIKGEHGSFTLSTSVATDGSGEITTTRQTNMNNGDYTATSVTYDSNGQVVEKHIASRVGNRSTSDYVVRRGGNPNENYDDKQYNDCVKGAGGCAKKTRSKPMDTVTQPSKGDADADPGSSPIIGAAAVTNEDEFHSGGGGGGGGGGVNNIDILTQPPTEGAEGGGSIPPPPTPGGG